MAPYGDNIIPLRPRSGRSEADLPVPVENLAETVDAIGRCLSQTTARAELGHGSGGTTATSLLLAMGVVERRLEELSAITVVNWPDVLWAMRFANARVRALTAVRDSAARLSAVRTNVLPRNPLVESSPLGRALREVRDLIVERYPQTFRVCG